MKERYTKCFGCALYIKEIKRHWWSKWKIEKIGGVMPTLYGRQDGKFTRVRTIARISEL